MGHVIGCGNFSIYWNDGDATVSVRRLDVSYQTPRQFASVDAACRYARGLTMMDTVRRRARALRQGASK